MDCWKTKKTVATVAVAIGVCWQCLGATPAGSRFDCTKPDHRDYTPGWTARHESFNAIAAKGDVDLVFLGDSITHGWERQGAETWKTYYGQRKAANFGIDGDQTQHVIWRIDHGNFAGIKPRLIVIMLGTNNAGHNTPGEVAEAMGLIVKRLREELPGARLLLLGIFPRGFKADDPLRAANAKANDAFSRLADDTWVHYLDIGREFLEKDGTISPEIMPDGVHPTARGYELWARAIEATVTEVLEERKQQHE
jgi:lysophospholipase L1-like esterase